MQRTSDVGVRREQRVPAREAEGAAAAQDEGEVDSDLQKAEEEECGGVCDDRPHVSVGPHRCKEHLRRVSLGACLSTVVVRTSEKLF